ncbi:hypothetical protein [Chitinasiproducens palmae]|uniref:Flagellar protein FlgJ N-terminal domain-containing protein n=1 Tax=Chitinasiproducens palmae TaxID=1770053 RepID=A0A1H2PMJ3_9BURK|nr:hypothetical protein [Chitinasiproducens palmae]SDV46956.1 hypothetical protein SAMN05216551_102136 [Chitinasiproducens palmae]
MAEPFAAVPTLHANRPAPAPRAASRTPDVRIARAGQQLESLFAEQLLKVMWRTVDGFAPESERAAARGREGLDAYLDSLLADHLASRQALGVARFVTPLLEARDTGAVDRANF